MLALPPNVAAFNSYGYGEDNPFVEAMLRMMEIFGLIDRDRLPLGVPYMPGYGQQLLPGLGGLGGLGGYPGLSPLYGLGGAPGLSSLSGFGGVPGLSPLPGLGGVPGVPAVPGTGGFPGAGNVPYAGAWPGPGGLPGGWSNLTPYGAGLTNQASTYLNGVWELQNGSFVIIQGNVARLYLSRTQYQDFAVYYDRQNLWWRPQRGGTTSRYRYRTRDGRMVLRDHEGNMLLMRQRR